MELKLSDPFCRYTTMQNLINMTDAEFAAYLDANRANLDRLIDLLTDAEMREEESERWDGLS